MMMIMDMSVWRGKTAPASFAVSTTAARDLGEKEEYTSVLLKLTPILESSFQPLLPCSTLFIGLATFIYELEHLTNSERDNLMHLKESLKN